MAAGSGAIEQARRARERVEKLRQELARAEQQLHAWEAGAAGEQLVAARLAELEPEGWKILHDVHWPGRPKANLDHVLIGPGGVIVTDTKNWSGEVELRRGELRQNGNRAGRIDSVLDQAGAIAALLEPQHRHVAAGWICLAGQTNVSGSSNSGVRIECTETLLPAVRSLPPVLDSAAVEGISHYLEGLLSGDQSPGLWTTKELDAAGDGASRALHARRVSTRAGARPSAATHVPSRRHQTERPTTRRKRKQVGLAGAVIRLSLLVIGAMTLLNILDGVNEPAEQIPAPIPVPTLVEPQTP